MTSRRPGCTTHTCTMSANLAPSGIVILTVTITTYLLCPSISSSAPVIASEPPSEQPSEGSSSYRLTQRRFSSNGNPVASSQNQIISDLPGLSQYLQRYSGLDDRRDIYPDIVVNSPESQVVSESQPLDTYIRQQFSDPTAPQPQTAGPVDVYTPTRNNSTTRDFHQDYYVDIDDILTGLEEGGDVPYQPSNHGDQGNDDLEEGEEEEVNNEGERHWWNWVNYNSNSVGEGDRERSVTTPLDGAVSHGDNNNTSTSELRPTPYYRTETEESRNRYEDNDNDISLDLRPGYPVTSEAPIGGDTDPDSSRDPYYNNLHPESSTDPGWLLNQSHSTATATAPVSTDLDLLTTITGAEGASSEVAEPVQVTATATSTADIPITTTTQLPGELQTTTQGYYNSSSSITGWIEEGVDNNENNTNSATGTVTPTQSEGEEGSGEGDLWNHGNVGGVSEEGEGKLVTSRLFPETTSTIRSDTAEELEPPVHRHNNNSNNNEDVINTGSSQAGSNKYITTSTSSNRGLVVNDNRPNDRNKQDILKEDNTNDDADRWDRGIVLGSTLTIAGVIVLGIMITLCCACVRREKGTNNKKVVGDEEDSSSEGSYGFNTSTSATTQGGRRVKGGSGESSSQQRGGDGSSAGEVGGGGSSVNYGGGEEEIHGEAHEIHPQKTSVFASAFNSLTWKRKDKKKNKKPQVSGCHGDSGGGGGAPVVSVKDRVKAFEGPPGVNGGGHRNIDDEDDDEFKPRKKKPQSKAFEEFENSGLIIGFGNPRKTKAVSATDSQESVPYTSEFPGFHIPEGERECREEASPVFFNGASSKERVNSEGGSVGSSNDYRMQSKCQESNTSISLSSGSKLTEDEGIHTMDSEGEDDDFSNAVPRQTEILKSFRRAPPPRNKGKSRRPPQRKSPLRETSTFNDTDVREEDENEADASHTMQLSQSNNKLTAVNPLSGSQRELLTTTGLNPGLPRQALGSDTKDEKKDFSLLVGKSTVSETDKSDSIIHKDGVKAGNVNTNWNPAKKASYVNPSQQGVVKAGYGYPNSINTNGNTSRSGFMYTGPIKDGNGNVSTTKSSSVNQSSTKDNNVNPNSSFTQSHVSLSKSSYVKPSMKESAGAPKTGVVKPMPNESNVKASGYVKQATARESVNDSSTTKTSGVVNLPSMFKNSQTTLDTTNNHGSYKSTLLWTLNPETPSEESTKQKQQSRLTKHSVGPSWVKRNYDLTEEERGESPPLPVPPKLDTTSTSNKTGSRAPWWGSRGNTDSPGRENTPPAGVIDTKGGGSQQPQSFYRFTGSTELGSPDNNNAPKIEHRNLPRRDPVSESRKTKEEEERLNNNLQTERKTYEAEATFSNQGGNYSFYTPNPLEQESDEDKPQRATGKSQSDGSKLGHSQWSHDHQSCDNNRIQFAQSDNRLQRDASFDGGVGGTAKTTKPISGLGQSSEVTYKPFYTQSSKEKTYHRQSSMPTYPHSGPPPVHLATNTHDSMHGPTTTTHPPYPPEPHRSLSYSPTTQHYHPSTLLSHGPSPQAPSYRQGQTQGYYHANEVAGGRSQLHGTSHTGSSVITPSASLTEKPTFEATDEVFDNSPPLPSNKAFFSNALHHHNRTSNQISNGKILPSPADSSYHSNITSPMDTNYPNSNQSPISPVSNNGFHGNASYTNQRYSSSGSHDQTFEEGTLGFSSTKSRGSSLKFKMESEGTSV